MNHNPLEQYFRQPKIFISLPSLGMYSNPSTFAGPVEDMPVYGMTGMDEIIIKTPDALMSGMSSIKVIESCCPSIADANQVSSIDTNVIFAAIRIATYGNKMKLAHTCDKCKEHNDYELDLMTVIESYAGKKFNNRVVVDDLVIRVRPASYRQAIDFNVRNFRARQQLAQIERIEDDAERQSHLEQLWKEIADIQQQLYKNSVESIETPASTVTERGYIEEWLANCDTLYIEHIRDHLAELKQQWDMPAYPVKCSNCQAPANLRVDLDHSSFFLRA